MMGTQEAGAVVAEGKTKILALWPADPALVVMEHKDAITAGDGARRHVLPGKGAWSCATLDACFRLLDGAGLPTHYVRRLDERRSLARRCSMVPVEVVARRLAAGSYLKRHPEVPEGGRFEPPLIELFLKDDARHDPLVTEDELVAAGVVTAGEVTTMVRLAGRAFMVLEEAWARLGITLVDLKIECGRDAAGDLVIADVIDNDSWRLWPGGRREQMLDKQIYRNLAEVTDEGLARVAANYARVAQLAGALVDRTGREGDGHER